MTISSPRRATPFLALAFVVFLGASCTETPAPAAPANNTVTPPTAAGEPGQASAIAVPSPEFVAVTKVTDGDTFTVERSGVAETVRIIGINTPETVDPRRPVECFGKEASDRAKTLLSGAQVRLVADPTQDQRDKYGRTLAHVFLADGTNVGLAMIADGYAYEYTYDSPYQFQAEYRAAQAAAVAAMKGLWAEDTCAGQKTMPSAAEAAKPTGPAPAVAPAPTPAAAQAPAPAPAPATAPSCTIKGNISSSTGEKIYHVPGCSSYNSTVIKEADGERWFCSEGEAVAAGWRKAKNCP